MDDRNLIDSQERLARYKDLVVNAPGAEIPSDLKALASEWRRSHELGLDKTAVLTDSQRDFEVFNRIDELHRRHLRYLIDYYSNREKLIKSFGGAIFYLDDMLTAYNKGGAPDTLNALKANGVRIGTNFKQENTGIFVANMALSFPFETFRRVGHENYMDIFSEYVCYARYMAKSGRRWRAVNLILIPLDKWNDTVNSSINFLLEAEDMSANIDFIYPYAAKRINFLERISKFSNDIFMLLDEDLNVLFTNELFQKEFGNSHMEINLEPLSSFMPALYDCPKFRHKLGSISNFVLPLENALGVERLYTVFVQGISGYGYRCCFVPNMSYGTANSTTRSHYSFRSLIGQSPRFVKAIALAQRAAGSLSNVLITGESGTGKELFAQSIHSASPRGSAPFIPVNCAAIPKELIDSELMGYDDGSFTGAKRGGKPGKFEIADGGTIFLDEIAEMPMDMQCSLLRILEDGVINRVGSSTFKPINTRVIAATNKDLWKCVQAGTFRLDLYFRLNVLRIELPSLKERTGDIDILIPYFLDLSAYKNRSPLVSFSPEVMDLFRRYSWPGNLRELKNTVERCVIMADADVITIDNLPSDIYEQLTCTPVEAPPPQIVTVPTPAEAVPQSMKDYQSTLIQDTLAACGGNKSLAAKQLGISRSTLYKYMSEMNS